MDTARNPEWVTAFDWRRAGSEDRNMARLSERLLHASQERLDLPDPANGPDYLAFGRYIATLREARGWSRVELAEQAGIDPLAVPLVEHAALTIQECSPGLVARLARAFSLAVEDLAVNPIPMRPIVPAPQSLSSWLRERLAGLLVPLAPQAGPAYRGAVPAPTGTPAGTAALLAHGVLSRPLALPGLQHAFGGRQLEILPTLEAANPPQPGVGHVVIRLVDTEGVPVAGVRVELELAGLPFAAAAPTDAAGVARILDVPLEMLAAADHLELRLG
jgi:hypothetical protein